NGQGLVGSAARQPGPARERLRTFTEGRDQAAGSRLDNMISGMLGSDSAHSTEKALLKERSQAGRPAFERAAQGGQLPAVEKSLARDYEKANLAESKAQAAQQRAQRKATDLERAAADQGVAIPRAPTRLSTFLIRN